MISAGSMLNFSYTDTRKACGNPGVYASQISRKVIGVSRGKSSPVHPIATLTIQTRNVEYPNERHRLIEPAHCVLGNIGITFRTLSDIIRKATTEIFA
jgi:hypothetical protein